ncbi:hypothetical protein SAMN02745885_01850 [Carboxydocella sporoproducens DSM 16521]|uniref:Uncharacterized protein n=2 Tax=Carboxydocella TaxID=178898 RepID=A0A1T4QYW0_9FIRM|nr:MULTISPECIES: hypothetical protein [Carboxydocella]AVX19776.1 hypothetical protein CFE_0577 [Carboxydocella thermautotrophica]AVX30185.1 hypothetical protein CTH_0582 [Carboxydocella thermautotrophica]SKA08777.1 hypothetical protein SAMN02745885_01850 [Carboxydocella sporoproducens DSM 16521]
MRIIAVMPDQQQASALIDSLHQIGLDRQDLIVSNIGEKPLPLPPEKAVQDVIWVQTETERLADLSSFAGSINGLEEEAGILIAVEIPKGEGDKVRALMKEAGAIRIIQD